jgi:hypothetical protein
MNDTLELVRASDVREVDAKDFLPIFTVQQAVDRKKMVNQFIAGVLVEGEDYGTIPGTNTKKVLLKPGAEKLCSIFGLSVTYTEDKIIEDWTGAEHGGEALFYYSYRCQLSRGGRFMGEAIGSCNSWESKYRYRWLPEDLAKQRADFDSLIRRGGVTTKFEPNFALDKKETTGRYAKPAQYWADFEQAIKEGRAKNVTKKLGNKEYDGWEMTMDQTQYRVPNPEIADTINTCQKMAQKRSLVAAVLVVTNCSDAFTQDVEDFAVEAHSDSVREQQTKPEPIQESKTIPAALKGVFIRLRQGKPSETIKAELTNIGNIMIERAGERGSKEYDRITMGFKERNPDAKKWTPLLIEDMFIELWGACEALEAPDLPDFIISDRPFGGQ